ncbi:Uma2 family endonuclease [Amycolatopsis sulphurea]|uniref:Uma2 family endonuclease n=1 Tax=Amycolatopsis sulphurea TaxID=76022 RepID=A0A2A9FCG4_9PSEU|nr:Uma2 family endonuclease [Amycolatopsis sulphurea]PFG49054.1 Uma2 family endonuclease [Amycolatopsis sulphurea]
MTARPEPTQSEFPWKIPDHLLSIEEYAALGEPESGFTELVEGRVVMSPSPIRRHNRAAYRLSTILEPQLPPELDVNLDLDVDLGLTPPGQAGFSRRPDFMITYRAANERVDRDSAMFRANEVLVVVEVVSPGSKRTDHKTKHSEYAEAGIPFYWILDLTQPISLVVCHRDGESRYRNGPAVTGVFTTTEPFPCKIDLNALLD